MLWLLQSDERADGGCKAAAGTVAFGAMLLGGLIDGGGCIGLQGGGRDGAEQAGRREKVDRWI